MRSYRGAEQRQPSAGARRRSRRMFGSGAARVAEGAARSEPGDLEGHRHRPAARRSSSRDGPAVYEAVANGDPGRRSGASSRSPTCCASSASAGSATSSGSPRDVHYCAAHHYDPARARFTEFDPFWEFVAGPLQRRHVRPEHARRHVRPGGEVHRHPAGDEGESSAERGLPVLRHAEDRRGHPGDDRAPAQPRRRAALSESSCRLSELSLERLVEEPNDRHQCLEGRDERRIEGGVVAKAGGNSRPARKFR